MTYSGLLFSGLSRNDFYNTRDKRNLKKLVEVHHIIPREFTYHPTVLFSEYDIENGYNLMFLPTRKGCSILNIHFNRPIHCNGHIKYNRHVALILDEMFIESKTNQHNLCKLNKNLRRSMRHLNIPL